MALIVSLVASIIGALSGGGAGNLVLPALISVVSIKPTILVGSVFLMYFVSSVTGLVAYSRKGLVDYSAGILLGLPCVPGVVLGTVLENVISDFEFKLGLGALTATLAIVVYIQKRRSDAIISVPDQKGKVLRDSMKEGKNDPKNWYQRPKSLVDKSGRVFTYSPNINYGMVINFLAALMAGIFGAGAGVVIIPTTIILVRIPSHVAIATTRIVLLILDFAALITHVGIGTFDYTYAVLLSAGSVVGTILGAHIAFRISPDLLTKIIALVFGVIGVYLLLSTF